MAAARPALPGSHGLAGLLLLSTGILCGGHLLPATVTPCRPTAVTTATPPAAATPRPGPQEFLPSLATESQPAAGAHPGLTDTTVSNYYAPPPDAIIPRGASRGSSPTSAPARTTARKIQPGEPPIRINYASAAELQRLPGVGPVLAQRIIERRQQQPFGRVDELRGVPGIGPKVFERLRPFVTTD